MKKHFVLLFLIMASLFWAGNYMFGKFLVTEMSPLQMTFSRWLIAALFLFPIAQWIEKPDWKKVWEAWKLLLVMAVLGIVGYNFLLYEALQYTSSLNAALVNAMNPAVIVLFSALLLKEKITLWGISGLCISLLGVLLVLTDGNLQLIFRTSYNRGDLLMLVAILVWTFYSIMGRKMKAIPPISALAVSVVLGLILLVPFILVSGLYLPQTTPEIISLLYIGLFPTVGSFIFWNTALRYIDASRAGIFLNLIVVFTAIFSLLLGKPITIVQVAGGLLVFVGVYLTSKKKIKEKVQEVAKIGDSLSK